MTDAVPESKHIKSEYSSSAIALEPGWSSYITVKQYP